jgi:hypothetical protein
MFARVHRFLNLPGDSSSRAMVGGQLTERYDDPGAGSTVGPNCFERGKIIRGNIGTRRYNPTLVTSAIQNRGPTAEAGNKSIRGRR